MYSIILFLKRYVYVFVYFIFSSMLCAGTILPGAEQFEKYLHLLKNKEVALVVNHSSMTKEGHLVDVLLHHGIRVKKIFAPEHGFRGEADAGAHVKNSKDSKTGLPIVSLYGKHKKPSKADLKGIDIIVFDIQDVGVRFYTYLSTLHYVMEAGAAYDIPLLVLDRPNPNAHYVDGPVLKKKFRSFVGLDPVPIVYGMTIGEYAKMLHGEGWLKGRNKVYLRVIPVANYSHKSLYQLPVKPSPNLPSERSILLYPSLAFFEGTVISEGRGTKKPFEVYGAPAYKVKTFSFIPRSRVGARFPKFKNRRCYGVDLSKLEIKDLRRKKRIDLSYILDAYKNYPDKKHFFRKNNFIDTLYGSDALRKMIEAAKSEAQIRKTWEKDLSKFKKIREKYLLYS